MTARPPQAPRLSLGRTSQHLCAATALAAVAIGAPVAEAGGPPPDVAAKDAAGLIKWSMARHQRLATYRASCSWAMSFGPRSAETRARRLLIYAWPNRFRVVSDSGRGQVATSACDGARLIEYSHRHPRPVVYPAPRTIADAATLQMGHPMFCGSLLYRFFGGPTRYDGLVDRRRGGPTMGPETLVGGTRCLTVRFYAKGTYGRTELAIGAGDGLVRRITYGSEPLLAMMKRDMRGGAPTISRTTETYSAILPNARLAGDVFRLPLPPIRVASNVPPPRPSQRAQPGAPKAAVRHGAQADTAPPAAPVRNAAPVPIPLRHVPRGAPVTAVPAIPVSRPAPAARPAASATVVARQPVVAANAPRAAASVKTAPTAPKAPPQPAPNIPRQAAESTPVSAKRGPVPAPAAPQTIVIPQPTAPPSWTGFENRPPRLPLGQPAPEFAVRDPSGRAVTLRSLRGKVAVVTFWATWEPRCSEWLQKMQQVDREGAGKGVVVLAVSNQPKPKAEAFAAASRYTLPVYGDPGKAAGARLRVPAVPTTLVIDRRGRVQAYFVGMPSVFRLWRELQSAGLDQAGGSP